jgi:hypothetical protein
VARYPYSPRLTTEDCLDALDDLRDPSIEILSTSNKFPDDFFAEEPFLESLDNLRGGVEAGDKVEEGLRVADIRLAPFSTMDILLSATIDGRLSSGTTTGVIGLADSLRRDRPIGCDLASGKEPVGLLIVGIVLSGEGIGTGKTADS